MISSRGEVKALKEITKYECEVCGTNYKTPEEAQECEDSHPKVKEVRYKYGSIYEMLNAYPHGIEVEFENGTTVFYRECG
jgi:hypothetical protein